MERKEKAPAFLSIIDTIKEISDKTYQTYQWVARKNPKDYAFYENAVMYFIEDTDVVLESRNDSDIQLTDLQYQVLKKLYDMVDAYDSSEDRPEACAGGGA